MRWTGHVAFMGVGIDVCRIFMGKSGRKRPLGKPRRRYCDNIKMDFQEMGLGYGLDQAGSG
jgi:hypothetical protein